MRKVAQTTNKSLPRVDQGKVSKPATRVERLQLYLGRFRHVKTVVMAIAGGGAVLSGLVGYYSTYQAVANKTSASTSAAAVPAVKPLSIIVLPFANQTGDEKKAYVADALTSAISSDLSRIQGAFIVPTTTAIAFRNKQWTLAQIGREAGVRFVLTGGVTSSNDQLRIDAQLSDTISGEQLWASNFEGNQRDLFALQDQVTTRISNSIGPKMIIVAARESEKRKNSPQVADLLMRIRALLLKQQSLQNWQAIEALDRQALEADPENPEAILNLARSLSNQAFVYPVELKLDRVAAKAMATKAAALAQQVRAVDPGNPLAYPPLVLSALVTEDLDTALQSSKRWLELEPRSEISHRFCGIVLNLMGDAEEAKAVLEKGLLFSSPARAPIESYLNLSYSAFILDKPTESLEWARKAVDANPTFARSYRQLALASALTGDVKRAQAAAVEAVRLKPGLSMKTELKIPWPGKEEAYRRFVETKLNPAWRLAGLPE